MDITLFKATAPTVSCTFSLADCMLLDDLCTYARGAFEAPDAETQTRFFTALDRIQDILNEVLAVPETETEPLTDEQRAFLQAATPSREVH